MAASIVPLTPDRWPALAALFEQGGDPRWCWCAYWRKRGLDWSNSTGASNRDLLRGLVEGGRPPGLVALDEGGAAVGWVSVGPRADYERLGSSKLLAPVDDQPVWSIVCFVVARRARGQGVARALLDAAVAWAADHGAPAVEAYPVDVGDGRVTSASAYTGVLSMFEAAGFDVVTVRQWNATTRPRHIVRKTIAPERP